MPAFTTTDGRELTIVPGFREAVLRGRPSGTPTAAWTQADYDLAATRRVVAARRRIADARLALGQPGPLRALDIGCGAGLESVIAAADRVGEVIALDRVPALLAPGDRGTRAHRLVTAALAAAGSALNSRAALAELPLQVRAADAAALGLADDSIDLVWSRAALEHLQPLDATLRELTRVVRPGGIAHHVIDPYFWVKGCHAGGLIDIPWAHARLAPEDFARAALQIAGARRGVRRAQFVTSLNRLGIAAWRVALLASGPWDLVSWSVESSSLARSLLGEHPEVADTVLAGVTGPDLVSQSITAILRLRDPGKFHAEV
ncbi:class I SAM-dependent methyltransferase [Paraconexibacter antarcticus]|uniref:Class I SAM-dependent methyltransferase n=1 Tax=Paraconexibacter antarcticus TaxID=2949664 RepID=A0ABY5DNS7_9ACTN|nr:class I SAM-dependent methyltransferase [Paraconexibacter antarcticus]UTI62274.1 class I SAM-dependent methyltransferase [Paraconexibacter antarcticus]